MLERNRLHPPLPQPPTEASVWDWSDSTAAGLFASAEDYDSTGILAGVDPCESRYWWMPEMHASGAVSGHPASTGGLAAILERTLRGAHAARRAGPRTTAAA